MAGVATGSKMQMGGFPCHQFDVSDVAGARARGGVESRSQRGARAPPADVRMCSMFECGQQQAAAAALGWLSGHSTQLLDLQCGCVVVSVHVVYCHTCRTRLIACYGSLMSSRSTCRSRSRI